MGQENFSGGQGGVTALAEGALLAAMAAIFAFLGVLIPPLSLITNFLWTIPLIVLIMRRGLRTGALAFVVTTILIMMFATPFRGLSLALEFGIMSLIYGYAFRNKLPVGRTLFYGSLAAMLGTVLVLGLTVLFTGLSLTEMYQETALMMDQMLEMYKQMGLLDRMAQRGITEEQLREAFELAARLSLSLLPGVLVFSSLVTALLSFFLSHIILKKMKFEIPSVPSFSTWRVPWYFIWGFIVALGVLLIGDYYQLHTLKLIGGNIMVVYLPVFFFGGLAVVKFYLEKFKVSPLWKGLIIFLVLFYFPLAAFILASIGMFDMVFDYRRLGN